MKLPIASSERPSMFPYSGIDVSKLRRAIERRKIYPMFQPIVALPNGAVAGFEVLARWQDEEIGAVPPQHFIRLAEQEGLIGQLMAQLIEDACTSALLWGGNFQLAFNLSPLQLADDTLPTQIETTVGRTGFPVSRVQLEVTESTPINDLGDAKRLIKRLQNIGLQIALDDFGAGFSGFARLQSLPFDQIKLDASFVRSMTTSRNSRKIVSAIVGLGQSLGIPVIAEGVETIQTAWMLTKLGCEFGQGYWYGRPSRANAIPAILETSGEHVHETSPLNLSCNLRMAQLNAIYANAPIALCFVDMRFRFVSANQKFAELIGVDLNSIIGRRVQEVRPDTIPLLISVLDAISQGRVPPPSECVTPDGNRVLLSTVSVAYDEDNEVVGISVATIDITNHKSSVATREFGRPPAGGF